MPIFEFACKQCQSRFETLVLNPQETVHCPECASVELEKLISAHTVGHISQGPAPCEAPACGTGACPACQ